MSGEFETLNMVEVRLSTVLQQIKYQLEDEDYTPICIIGKSGIGKTQAIAQLAAELGIGFKELRLAHYKETDLIGLPYIDDSTHMTKHAIASLLPPSNDTNQGILMLDEVTSADKNMRTAAYQLMDSSRKLGEYEMPKRWMIVACGNGPDDGGNFRGLEAAFMSRGLCWRVEPHLEDWKKWALKAEVHPNIIAYLSWRPSELHVMSPDPEMGGEMIACPRSWVALSTCLKNHEKRTEDGILSEDTVLAYSGGFVGNRVGSNFTAFYRNNQAVKVLDPALIIAGKIPAEKMRGQKDEVIYITAQNLVHLISKEIKAHKNGSEAGVDEDCLKKVANLMNWCLDLPKVGARLDMAITVIQDIASSVGIDFTSIVLSDEFSEACPGFDEFVTNNNVAIVAV